MSTDPFDSALMPEIWFAVLCSGLNINRNTGHISLQNVFNQVRLMEPPDESGIPTHGHVQGVLAVGLTGGMGKFSAEIDLRDMDENVLWTRPEGLWEFEVGLGIKQAAVFGQQLSVWVPEAGRYHFLIRVTPGHLVHPIPFEVARQIGPTEVRGLDTKGQSE